ncbi:MAG: sensor histidine kinase [Solirubrobacteraceae bacterium]
MNAAPAAVQPARRRRQQLVAAGWARTRRSPSVFDAVFAMVVTLATVAGSLGESHPDHGPGGLPVGQHVPAATPAAYLLLAVAGLALAGRRRRPVAVLAVSMGGVLAYTCLGYVNGAALLLPVIALYAVAATVPTRRAVGLSLATMLALMGASAAFDPLGATGGGFVLIPGTVAAALFLGLWVATRRAYTSRVAEEQARRAVDAERLRIARELHDVVAHTMATINVQAGVAVHVIDQQPGQATEALEAIKQGSKEGLRELRGILNVLRQADEPDSTAPAPRLAQLDALIDGTSRAGLPTTLIVNGRPQALSPTVDLAAYRIVQESLTNALRHAGPTSATVTLSYLEDHLILEILDRGQSLPAAEPGAGSGHGIPGMRERAHAAGGTLVAEPGPEGGFGVRARLPIHPPA